VLLVPVLFMAVHHRNVYTDLKLLVFVIAVPIGVGFPLTVWINRRLYDTKMHNVEKLLEEIREFEA
jgi:hypothetical protein